MWQVRDRRFRIALIVGLLVLIGIAGYYAVTAVWANYHYARAQHALERCDFAAAGESLERYLALQPRDAAGHVLAAQTARRREDFDEADRHLRLAAKDRAAADVIAVERDLLLAQAGDMSDARRLAAYCADNANKPEGAIALEALIEGSLRALQLGLAQKNIDLWLANRPAKLDQARGLYWRGRLSEFEDDWAAAAALYRQGLDLAPDFVPLRLRLVETLLRDDPRKAVADLDWLRQRAPRDPNVRYLTAILERRLGHPEEAAVLLDDLLAAEPKRVKALIERGRVALDMGKPQEAEPWLRRAWDLAGNQRDANIALADCLRQTGRSDEADVYQQAALRIEAEMQKKLDEMQKKK